MDFCALGSTTKTNGPVTNGRLPKTTAHPRPPPLSIRPRKYSLPVMYARPSPSEYAELNRLSVPSSTGNRRRRFSQAVTHHLTTTIGWRSSHSSHQEIVDQAKSLCGRYLRFKLRLCGAVHKKLGLQRLKSVSNITKDGLTSDVALELRQLTQELEHGYPKLFQSVMSNVGLHTLSSETVVQNLFQIIAQELFRADITWGRIVALYAITGALALDCVKLGKPDYVLGLVQCMGGFVERDLATWIAQQGGWVSPHSSKGNIIGGGKASGGDLGSSGRFRGRRCSIEGLCCKGRLS